MNRDVRRANQNLIEREIRNYYESKDQLDALKLEIIESSPQADVPAYTGPSDPVYKKVVQLRTCKVILEVERRLLAIEYAIKTFESLGDPTRVRAIEMHYFENRFTPAGIQQELNVSQATFYRWRREFIELIAERLGWEV